MSIKDAKDIEELVQALPGKDCGLCGSRTCRELAEKAFNKRSEIGRCVYLIDFECAPEQDELSEKDVTWKDILGREYDFILEKYPDDPGPREVILPFNPVNVERLGIKKGDILYGRPAWAGCPVTHCGVVVEEPDYFNGVIEWCIVGPTLARERGINIGNYNPVAYEGLAKFPRRELKFGMRYYFMPRYCMLQSRHSGLINTISKTRDGVSVRLEGIWIS